MSPKTGIFIGPNSSYLNYGQTLDIYEISKKSALYEVLPHGNRQTLSVPKSNVILSSDIFTTTKITNQ